MSIIVHLASICRLATGRHKIGIATTGSSAIITGSLRWATVAAKNGLQICLRVKASGHNNTKQKSCVPQDALN